jgi:uncharacterized protein
MGPSVSFITLGVDDLERALAFYRDGLGWPTKGIVGTRVRDRAVAFFKLQPGLTLALWPRASLARDSGVALQPRSATEFAAVAQRRDRRRMSAASCGRPRPPVPSS